MNSIGLKPEKGTHHFGYPFFGVTVWFLCCSVALWFTNRFCTLSTKKPLASGEGHQPFGASGISLQWE
jgi:hypothetical protein